jgi:hypothetical protein
MFSPVFSYSPGSSLRFPQIQETKDQQPKDVESRKNQGCLPAPMEAELIKQKAQSPNKKADWGNLL